LVIYVEKQKRHYFLKITRRLKVNPAGNGKKIYPNLLTGF